MLVGMCDVADMLPILILTHPATHLINQPRENLTFRPWSIPFPSLSGLPLSFIILAPDLSRPFPDLPQTWMKPSRRFSPRVFERDGLIENHFVDRDGEQTDEPRFGFGFTQRRH